MKFTGNKLFEKTIYGIIVLNLVAMVVESEPNLDEGFVDFLEKFEIVSIIVFAIEYLIRTGESIKS